MNRNERIGKTYAAQDLIDGDVFDLKDLPDFDRLPAGDRNYAEYELYVATDWDGTGAVEKVSEHQVLIHTDSGSFTAGHTDPITVRERIRR